MLTVYIMPHCGCDSSVQARFTIMTSQQATWMNCSQTSCFSWVIKGRKLRVVLDIKRLFSSQTSCFLIIYVQTEFKVYSTFESVSHRTILQNSKTSTFICLQELKASFETSYYNNYSFFRNMNYKKTISCKCKHSHHEESALLWRPYPFRTSRIISCMF